MRLRSTHLAINPNPDSHATKLFDEMPLRLLLPAFLFFLYSQRTSSLFTDSITPTQPLKDGQVLISGDGNAFAFGFFSPGNTTRHRYIGIWYNKVSEQTVVWVANRDRPIYGTDGILYIADDGNLLLSSRNLTVWSTQITPSNSSTVKFAPKAVLLDSGNLVLTLAGSHSAAWQSFDYPTHVFLPGMLLGVDRRTGFSRSLNSWRSKEDPGRGNYTFRVGPGSGPPEFYVYKDGSEPVWRTGPWVGERWSGVPEMTRSYIFNYTFVESEDEVYATYKMESRSIVSVFMLDGETGTVQRKTWHESSRQWSKFWAVPLEDCDQYANCGAFGLCTPNVDQFECSCLAGYEPKSARDWYLRDASAGCVRAANLSTCRNREGFLKLANVKVPDTSTAKSNATMSLVECRQECLNNCSCTAFTTATDDGNGGPRGCIWFYGDLVDTRAYDVGGGQDLFFRVDALELAKSDKSKAHLDKKHLAIILVCILFAFALSIFFVVWLYRKRRREYKEQKQRSLWLGEEDKSNSNSDLHAWKQWEDKNPTAIVEEFVIKSACGCEEEISRCVQIGLLCVQEDPKVRPTMLDVIFMLNNNSELQPPKEPAFYIKGNHHKYEDLLSSSTEARSVNELTITIVDELRRSPNLQAPTVILRPQPSPPLSPASSVVILLRRPPSFISAFVLHPHCLPPSSSDSSSSRALSPDSSSSPALKEEDGGFAAKWDVGVGSKERWLICDGRRWKQWGEPRKWWKERQRKKEAAFFCLHDKDRSVILLTYIYVIEMAVMQHRSPVFDEMSLRQLLRLLYLSLLYNHLLSASLTTDTMTPTRPLKDGQVLTSRHPNNNFALGFFTPGNNMRRRYVGVLYNNVFSAPATPNVRIPTTEFRG
ncbi:hypothetical protein V2J09_016000 [Rumex salicifolius]